MNHQATMLRFLECWHSSGCFPASLFHTNRGKWNVLEGKESSLGTGPYWAY